MPVISNTRERGVTNPLGSSLTKYGLLLWFKSYCIHFLNIPFSYISELFHGRSLGLDTVLAKMATFWKEDFDTIWRHQVSLQFSQKFLLIFQKTALIISNLTEKFWKILSHKIYGKSFLPKVFGKFFADFQFHLESFEIFRNA